MKYVTAKPMDGTASEELLTPNFTAAKHLTGEKTYQQVLKGKIVKTTLSL